MFETSRDWNIHKKLGETRRVYVMPARANDKTYTQLELYSELMTQNKEVKVIRAEDIRKAVELLKRDPILDPAYELWTNRDSELHRYLDELYKEDDFFKPIVRYDSWGYIENSYFREEQMLWLMNRYMTPVNPYLSDVYVIDKSKLD